MPSNPPRFDNNDVLNLIKEVHPGPWTSDGFGWCAEPLPGTTVRVSPLETFLDVGVVLDCIRIECWTTYANVIFSVWLELDGSSISHHEGGLIDFPLGSTSEWIRENLQAALEAVTAYNDPRDNFDYLGPEFWGDCP